MSKYPGAIHHEHLIVAWALWRQVEGDQPPFALDEFIDDATNTSNWFVCLPFARAVWNGVLRMAGYQTAWGPEMNILVGDLSRLVSAYDVENWTLGTLEQALSVADKFIWADYRPSVQELAGTTPRRTTKDSISTLAEAIAEAKDLENAAGSRCRYRVVRDLLGV